MIYAIFQESLCSWFRSRPTNPQDQPCAQLRTPPTKIDSCQLFAIWLRITPQASRVRVSDLFFGVKKHAKPRNVVDRLCFVSGDIDRLGLARLLSNRIDQRDRRGFDPLQIIFLFNPPIFPFEKKLNKGLLASYLSAVRSFPDFLSQTEIRVSQLAQLEAGPMDTP